MSENRTTNDHDSDDEPAGNPKGTQAAPAEESDGRDESTCGGGCAADAVFVIPSHNSTIGSVRPVLRGAYELATTTEKTTAE